ncbi:hypothetical protein QTP88_021555 [Uroleucon formosanum]
MVDKRKLGDLDCGEVTKKKQKKGNVDKSKNKDVEREKKSRTCKDVSCKQYSNTIFWPTFFFPFFTSSNPLFIVIYFCDYETVVKLKRIVMQSRNITALLSYTSSMATNLLSTISSFKFVTHLLLMKNIFKHTSPLSIYLQSPSLDFIIALTMVDNCARKLSELRNELHLDILLAEAKKFSLENELEEVWFPEKRVQRQKKMAGEKINDEIVTNAKDNFKIQVYFTVLDQICTSITSRFEGSREILSDLSLLSVDRLIATNKGSPIPEDNFVYLDKWIPNLQIDQLKLEYSTFAYNFLKFKSTITIEKLHEKVMVSESDEDTSVDSDEVNSEETKTKMTVLNVLKLLNTFNLISAFPNMYMAYKFLCTIPATSVSSERTFSKLKLIKTRIRSTMVQKRLDSLMLLSCEKDIIINIDEAINKYANTSKLLQEALLYK